MGLLVFVCRADLRAEWKELVMSVDASLSGYAVTGKYVRDPDLLHGIGCWDERWGFNVLRGEYPRDVLKLQSVDELSDPGSFFESRGPEPLEVVEDLTFPNVPKGFATDRDLC